MIEKGRDKELTFCVPCCHAMMICGWDGRRKKESSPAEGKKSGDPKFSATENSRNSRLSKRQSSTLHLD